MAEIRLPIGDPKMNPPQFTELIIGTEKFMINANGEAVDSTGKVIKTKEEVEKLKTPEPTEEEKAAAAALAARTAEIEAQLIEGAEIELDDKKYILDKNGNIVIDGKVFKTKDELKTLLLNTQPDTSSDDLDYVSEIQKTTNLTVLDNNGTPIAYENTLPGITQYVQDVHREGIKLGKEEFEQELFGKFPILLDIIDHLSVNGSLKDFVEDIDYSKITLTEDENQHIDLYTKAQLKRGVPQEEINDMIKYYKEDKKLKTVAATALTYLQTEQTTSKADRAKRMADAKAEAELEASKYWAEVDKAINGKQLVVGEKKFKLPDVIKVKDAEGKIVTKTLVDFKNYIEKPLVFNIGGKQYTMTQLEYDELIENNSRTPHHDLFDAYRRFTKYDDSQLIAANVSSSSAKQIIKLKSKVGGGQQPGGGKLILPIK